MRQVWVLTPVEVPDDTDPARVPEVVADALSNDDGSAVQWGELHWTVGPSVLVQASDYVGPAAPCVGADIEVTAFRITESDGDAL